MKRLMAFLVSLSLLLTCLSGITLVAFAADNLVLGDVTITHDGSGYVIDTADKFVAVFGGGNSATTYASGMVYHITEDIDLSSANYVPDAQIFNGTITGWENGSPAKKNINIGAVTATPVTVDSKVCAAGIFYNAANTSISYLTTSGSLTVDTAVQYVGGIIAYVSGNQTALTHIDNGITVTVTANGGSTVAHVGGAFGMIYNINSISYITNSGNVTNSASKGTAAGIAGGAQTGSGNSQRTASYLLNSGVISGNNYAGGIAGQNYFILENCGNTGSILNGTRVGGLVGYSSQTNTYYRYCFNSGELNGTSAVGGIVGTAYAPAKPAETAYREVYIENCYNAGKVKGASSSVEAGAAMGDPWHSGATVGSDTGASSITNFYDVVNLEMPLFEVSQAIFVKVDKDNAFVYSEKDDLANNKATRATILTKFTDSNVWAIDSDADYIYPTLVSNPYDDNLPAVAEPEIVEPELSVFEKNNISGSGTAKDPYIINTAAKFNAIFGNTITDSSVLDEIRVASFAITADIDLSALDYAPNTTMSYFTGDIYGSDGSGNYVQRTINLGTGRSFAANTSNYIGGIVGQAGYGAFFSHLTIEGSFTSTATKGTGSVAGAVVSGSAVTISNIINKADITAPSYAGGIIGINSINNLTITNCHNEGDITVTTSYSIGGIIGQSTNIKIEGCSNSGTIKNAATTSNGYVGGIVGYFKMGKYATDAYIKDSWNSGVIESGLPRNGGLIGILWKHREATSQGSQYDVGVEISNCYNVGSFEGGSVIGHIIGYSNTDTTASSGGVDPEYKNKPVLKGIYVVDPSIPLIGAENSCAKNTGVTYENNYVYSLDEDLTYTGATKINKNGLIGLPASSDEAFSDTTKWVAGSGSYPYPQIVGNPHTGAAIDLPDDPIVVPYTTKNIKLVYENGTYKITWTAEAPADSYELHIGDDVTPVTLNGDVTAIVKNKELDIMIYAIVGDNAYPSELTAVNGYFGGGSGVENDEYLIYDADHFANIEKKSTAHFKQMDDFTITTPIFLQEDKDLAYSAPVTFFQGVYDGNNKVLNLDLTLNDTGDVVYAPFAYIKQATIKNVTTDGTINIAAASKDTFVAGLVGNLIKSGTSYVQNCINKADITVADDIKTTIRVGGIFCYSYTSSPVMQLTNCKNYGNLEGTHVAGIIQRIRGAEIIRNCANYGNVTAKRYASGIAVESDGADIANCFNFGNVTSAGENAAGILSYSGAYDRPISILDCFNAGTITGTTTAGIAIERRINESEPKTYTIENCYSITPTKYDILRPYTGSTATIKNSYYVTVKGTEEGAVTLEGLKEVALGDAWQITGEYPYPQLKSIPVDADKAGIEFVTLTYKNDGNANIDRRTSDGYIKKGSEIIFYVESKNADFISITVSANDTPIDESIIEKKGIKYIVNDNTVINAAGVAIEADTPVIQAGTSIHASTGSSQIIVDGEPYTRYAISAGRAPKVAGWKLKEFGILINNMTGDFDILTAKAKAQAEIDRISPSGAYGILIYGDGKAGLKDNKLYYTRPYAIYEDINGEEFKAYGEIQSFVLSAPAVAE